MDDPVLWISVLIVGVCVGGMFILADMPTPTGNVVADCGCVPSEPVCAAEGHSLVNYASVCHAECFGRHIVFAGRCEDITPGVQPKITTK